LNRTNATIFCLEDASGIPRQSIIPKDMSWKAEKPLKLRVI
jgi:hypothetical protein|tara:strand:+ start:406 stop:528 length:123 start_codon:yes stop_codon:yes gene_type:complete